MDSQRREARKNSVGQSGGNSGGFGSGSKYGSGGGGSQYGSSNSYGGGSNSSNDPYATSAASSNRYEPYGIFVNAPVRRHLSLLLHPAVVRAWFLVKRPRILN
jgi:hypothetical protein